MQFFDRDLDTGALTPTSYESMRAYLASVNEVSENIPDNAREKIETAIEFTALGYEQAHLGRMHLLGHLSRSATTLAVLALELTLKRQLGDRVKRNATLGPLIDAAREHDLLPETGIHGDFVDELLRNRNQIVHGHPDAPVYGLATHQIVGAVVDLCNMVFERRPSRENHNPAV